MGAAAGMAVATMGATVVFDKDGKVANALEPNEDALVTMPNPQAPALCGVDGITQLDQIESIQPDWVDPNTYDNLLAEVRDFELVDEDVTFEDGTVIPAVYVNLRNLINRMGKGFGGHPDATSYELIMHLWTPEEAAYELEMPMLSYFNAYDYSLKSGRSIEECAEILESMAKKCLIYHVVRGGANYYMLLPHINGWWEFTELKAYFDAENAGEDHVAAVADYNQYNTWSVEGAGVTDFDNTFPLFRSYPVSLDVIAEDEFLPYMDWRAIIERNQMITVSPCQCRIMWEAIGVPYPEELPQRTCLSLGEMAEYFIENGIGEQITQEEAISIVEDALDKGMVPESIATKDADIICLCHGEACGNLMGFKGMAQSGLNAWKNFNAYWLDYDAEKCIKCGACIARCPMEAISFDGDDGACAHNLACVRCGQCVTVCPADARILRAREDFPEYPEDYLDSHRTIAKERAFRGAIADYVG
jgi:ferredoxin